MYCKNCGKIIDDSATYCINCGTRFDNNETDDRSSFGFALLGYFIPIVGLILFLIYEGKKPKRAKSAGKGALSGFVSRITVSIILGILYAVFTASLLSDLSDDFVSYIPPTSDVFEEETTDEIETNTPSTDDIFKIETTDEILEKYVDVYFGEFKVIDNGYSFDTSLDITVKNKAEKQYTYDITIEAVDANGARIGTDIILVDRLGAGQEIYLTAFEYVDEKKINQFKNATFRVLDINKYDF